ncbi:unnamed protein product [Paramecium octaurelia]|uniref:Uncharacterized protein n=1 Tax=Paramecium octaurelia TaxID=43137 RepID=A0A8S1XC48_PAROT|nr:unnamed protein product [Paramecium octaurelia]
MHYKYTKKFGEIKISISVIIQQIKFSQNIQCQLSLKVINIYLFIKGQFIQLKRMRRRQLDNESIISLKFRFFVKVQFINQKN